MAPRATLVADATNTAPGRDVEGVADLEAVHSRVSRFRQGVRQRGLLNSSAVSTPPINDQGHAPFPRRAAEGRGDADGDRRRRRCTVKLRSPRLPARDAASAGELRRQVNGGYERASACSHGCGGSELHRGRMRASAASDGANGARRTLRGQSPPWPSTNRRRWLRWGPAAGEPSLAALGQVPQGKIPEAGRSLPQRSSAITDSSGDRRHTLRPDLEGRPRINGQFPHPRKWRRFTGPSLARNAIPDRRPAPSLVRKDDAAHRMVVVQGNAPEPKSAAQISQASRSCRRNAVGSATRNRAQLQIHRNSPGEKRLGRARRPAECEVLPSFDPESPACPAANRRSPPHEPVDITMPLPESWRRFAI